MVTHDPLHRSGHAALLHPAPALGNNAEAHERVGVADAGGREPSGEVPRHPTPRERMGLAATQKNPPPQPPHCPTEEADSWAVHGHAVIPDMPTDDRAQVGPLLRDGEVHAPPQLGFHLLQLRLQPLPDRLPQHGEHSTPLLPTDVGETQEVERFRLTLTPPPPVPVRERAELDEAGLVRVQREAELGEPLPKRGQEALGFGAVLEAHDEVIGEADDDHVADRLRPPPSVDPQVEHIVQVDVSQEGADDAPYAKGNFVFERTLRYRT